MMLIRMTKPAAAALALSLGLSLAACSNPSQNRSLESIRQPVVERSNYTLEVNTGSGGLTVSEQSRLNAWFEAMEVRYGDRISIDDPLASAATKDAVAEIAARYGLLLSPGSPVTQGIIEPGKARVVITRSRAHVPGCPDWSDRGGYNYTNATHSDFGCAVNSNLAAMVADPEHLVRGATGTGETVIMTSNKAIETFRNRTPSGASGALGEISTGGD